MVSNAPTPLEELVDAQHGVVTHAQLLEHGLSADAIDRSVHRRALRRLHTGVYAVGHVALRDEGRWPAAVPARGPDAVLSHRSAAQRWGMRSVPPWRTSTSRSRTPAGAAPASRRTARA